MIESIPPEVRSLCWEYLSVRDYGSLAMTCRTLEYDRRHSLNPTRFVCITFPTTEEALQRSHILHRNDPILLRLETPLPPMKHVSLSSVTELELEMCVPAVLSATGLPNVKTVTLLGNTRFQDEHQMGKLFQNIETLIIHGNDHLLLNGHDFRECQTLQTLILQDCCLQLPDSEASEVRCKSDFLSWIKAPLRSVTIRNVVQCPSSHAISQDMLLNFVRRRPQLHYFQSDGLKDDNKQRLRNEFPNMQII